MVLEPKESVYDNPQHAQQQAIYHRTWPTKHEHFCSVQDEQEETLSLDT